MDEGIGKTIKLFLLWWGLFLAPLFISLLVCRIFLNRIDYDYMDWLMLVGSLLIVAVFLASVMLNYHLDALRGERPGRWPV